MAVAALLIFCDGDIRPVILTKLPSRLYVPAYDRKLERLYEIVFRLCGGPVAPIYEEVGVREL